MSIFNKFINGIKVTEDTPDTPLQSEMDKETENRTDRRQYKRVPVLSSVCIFVPEKDEEVNCDSTPFMNANIYDLSLGGAAFQCMSFIACTPCDPDLEREIKQGSIIYFVPNMPQTAQKGCSSCSSQSAPENEVSSSDLIKAQVKWVKDNRFGCMFTSPTEAFIDVIEDIIDSVSKEYSEKK